MLQSACMWRVYVGLCVCLTLNEFSYGQATTGSGRPLLRMERAQPGELECVLVGEDGSYRVEKMFRAKTEVFTAPAGSLQIGELQAILANDKFAKLSQADIHQPLITDTIDDLLLAVWRGQSWQQLKFASRDSRKPFQEFMSPLLHWFQDVQKRRVGATRSNEAPTRCTPSRSEQEAVASNKAAASSTASRPEDDYLFRYQSSHFYKRVEGTCTIVFKDGHFHRERSNQEYLGKRRDKVADGELNDQAMQQLKDILNSSELRDVVGAGDPDKEKPIAMHEGTATTLTIPRQEKLQRLHFLTAQNTVLRNPLEQGGMSNMAYRTPDRKMLAPLLHWMEENTEKQAQGSEIEGIGNDCHPSRTDANRGNPAN